ncbi:DNA polymerase III subunit alpha [Verrucomicrobium spinosum]|uniref:DNA polymerase III subunit alpha n=2 Tax=Verrucomicrobium spinosum TaxID=2736 RepID=UPI000174583A|nr:error-prone DNA polymerase [Verrucomicrobium spinosum]
MSFVELHARTAFSFLRGASSPEEMMTRAADLGMDCVAITDRDGYYGSARAHYKGKELGLRAITGMEITMEDETVLPLLVATRQGYQNLARLMTRAKLRTTKGQSRVLWSELPEHAEGVVVLSGDEEGPVQRALQQNAAEAPAVVEKLCRIFGRNQVWMELQRHRMRGETLRNRQIRDLAELCKLPLLASNGPCHARQEGRMLMDAFTCLRHHTHLDAAGLLLAPNSQRHLKNHGDMKALFADLPEAMDNTRRLSDQLEFGLEHLGYEFPCYDVPPGHDQDSYLRELTYEGARRRFHGGVNAQVRAQLEKELDLISRLKFSGYFLIVWSLVKYACDSDILVQGRGSAANSAVCYSLGITHADPIAGKLLFERFLSEGRNSWPDIDLDLPSGDRREQVIQELYRRYAPYGAAMTANVITYRGRSAMREMGKVLNLPEDVMGRFSDLYANGDFPHTLQLKDQIRQAGLPMDHPRLVAMVRLYHQVYGLPRHLGQHSGGMVLCTKGLDSIVPLEPATMPGRVVVQWDKDDCEDLGIIKVDLLGLGMMAVLQDSLTLCKARGREGPYGLHEIPKDDPATYEMMQKADTIGVFQIESRAQMATLPRLKPECFYDLVIEVAIIRPGPIVGNMVHPYIRRRQGREKIDFIHAEFEDILQRTLGVPLFQEQLLRMAMVIAGFSGGEAEELRRAMSFHRSEERMHKVMDKLRAAMEERGVAQEVQEKITACISSFALYGFPESHAISFAILANASVWLKAHRAVEFYAGLLNNQPMGFYSTSTLVRDAKQHGLRIRPACVVVSDVLCTVEDDQTLRLGLNQFRGLSRGSQERIIAERAVRPWRDLDDFLRRSGLDKKERRVLAKAGALNQLGLHRRSALWQVELARQEEDLFTPREVQQEMPLFPMNAMERLNADYQTQRLTTGPHPMAHHRVRLPHLWPACELANGRHGQRIFVGGLVICRQRPGTAKGHMFISLEDETGIANAFVPSAAFEANRLVITQEPFLQIHGRLQIVDNVISIYALKIEALHFEVMLHAQSHDFR